jgi:hypothetical protein
MFEGTLVNLRRSQELQARLVTLGQARQAYQKDFTAVAYGDKSRLEQVRCATRICETQDDDAVK